MGENICLNNENNISTLPDENNFVKEITLRNGIRLPMIGLGIIIKLLPQLIDG